MINFIKPSATIITEDNPKEKIELIGRICYRSEDKICEGSADKFVANVMKNKHYSILEHVPLYFSVKDEVVPSMHIFFDNYEYLREILEKVPFQHPILHKHHYGNDMYCATNARVIAEMFDDIREGTEQFADKSMTLHDFKYGWLLKDAIPFLQSLFHCISNLNSIKFLIPADMYEHPLFKNISEEDHYDKVWRAVGGSFLSFGSLNAAQFRTCTVKFVCDRGISHELVRHRNCAFMQESTRYCDYTERGFEFIIPTMMDSETAHSVESLCYHAEDAYKVLIENNYPPEIARAVLPNALATTLVVTASIAEWNHIFDLRLFDRGGSAHPQMKELMQMAYDEMKKDEAIADMLTK